MSLDKDLQLVEVMKTVCANSGTLASVRHGFGVLPYITFDSPYSAPEKWASLGKWSKRFYPGSESVSGMRAEFDEWVADLSS